VQTAPGNGERLALESYSAFGRPDGSFQAIKHMLADMYVSATFGEVQLLLCAWALRQAHRTTGRRSHGEGSRPQRQFQQLREGTIFMVHGGMGFYVGFWTVTSTNSQIELRSLWPSGGLSTWKAWAWIWEGGWELVFR